MSMQQKRQVSSCLASNLQEYRLLLDNVSALRWQHPLL
jgi:hypothetical protein